jgi:hypothetical protein
MALTADIYPAHDYKPAKSDCDHKAAHAPCKECGAAEGAYVHTKEAADSGYTLTHVHATDTGAGAEAH